ncbi:hypothetical protein RND71_011698 [Anisodus tanguticus]|uniref:Uncharacterized protein n=1 Tax=Anisodus tanguticus TaxID=243964 RepID=A0AAE1SDW0_9SOLA|nr:hypothetical protein RND71_011698 [Anisodus tanguticus]
MEMEMEQQLEWNEAQKIVINIDLVAAAKQHLEFLATIDRNRWLNEGPGLNMAIYRYYSCWLPLLAKHSECPFFEGPLVVPLDCEWVWHCHRLNPVRYKTDCEQLYGRILDNHNVVSSVKGMSKMETKETWKQLYPNEPYDLDSARALSDNNIAQILESEKCSNYDLVSAVKRQSPFFYQVSRPHMINEVYLEGAVARYKGFLHLIRRNRERSINSFSVPTYDIDLIWHTHQLHPISYCKDLVDIMGKVLDHDDTDSDRTKGKKLDTGNSNKSKRMGDSTLQKELIGINKAGETHTLAELVGKEWLLLDSRWSLQFQTCSGDDGYLLALVGGSRNIYWEYFLRISPVGVKEEWLLFPGIRTTFILGDILRKEGYSSVLSISNNLKDKNTSTEETNDAMNRATEVV